jgi:hypothetical protein
MRLLLYVLAAWFVLSIPAALFFGRLCRQRDDPFGTIQTANDTGQGDRGDSQSVRTVGRDARPTAALFS